MLAIPTGANKERDVSPELLSCDRKVETEKEAHATESSSEAQTEEEGRRTESKRHTTYEFLRTSEFLSRHIHRLYQLTLVSSVNSNFTP